MSQLVINKGSARGSRKRPGKRSYDAASIGAVAAAAIALWWIVALAMDNPLLLPTPPAVAARFGELVTDTGSAGLASQVWSSLRRVLAGFAIALVSGIALGVAIASNRGAKLVFEPIINFTRPVPPLAFAPLLVVWFGIGELPKIIMVWSGAFPTIVIATAAAIGSVDLSWRRAALTLGAGRLYTLRRVVIPAALPGIMAGIRIAAGLAWSVLVAAEFIAADSGLGYMILVASRYLDTATIFVGIFCIGLLALAMDTLLQLLERRLIPWKGRGGS